MPVPADFSIQTFDEVKLKGKYFTKNDTAKCAVILCHGWTSTWAGMLKYAPVLEDCPCDLVMYDHRTHGESGGDYPTGGIRESKDLLAVTKWVQKEKNYTEKQIGWLGASWGAATVLMAGANEKDVAFIIADAPFQDWYSAIFERAIRDYGSGIEWMSYGVMGMVNLRAGVDFENASALKVASKIEEPVLLIHSLMDSETASHQSENIAEKLNNHSIFHLLKWGGDHTEDVRINKDRFKGLVNDFLDGLKGGVEWRKKEAISLQ